MNKAHSIILLLALFHFAINVSSGQKWLEPFTPVVTAYEDILKTKVVGGKTFGYEEPRYVYEDPSREWYIYERPKGVFTSRYHSYANHLETGAFRIDFYKDSIWIKGMDLIHANPYTREKYPIISGEGRVNVKNTSDKLPFSDIKIQPGETITQSAQKAYTFANEVYESDQNYIIVDYVFVGEDSLNRYIGEEHTFVLLDTEGQEINRIEHIQNLAAGPVATHRGKYISYVLYEYQSRNSALIIYDMKSHAEIFSSHKTANPFNCVSIGILSKNSNSIAPYSDGDSCYLLFDISGKPGSDFKTCSSMPCYVDMDKRRIITGCYTNEQWGKFDWPYAHYAIIEENLKNSIRF